MGLPMQSRSGDGSSGITTTTGISVLEGTALLGDACADGSWRGALWSWAPKWQCHRAQGFAWVWGIAGRAGGAFGRAPPLGRVHLCYV